MPAGTSKGKGKGKNDKAKATAAKANAKPTCSKTHEAVKAAKKEVLDEGEAVKEEFVDSQGP